MPSIKATPHALQTFRSIAERRRAATYVDAADFVFGLVRKVWGEEGGEWNAVSRAHLLYEAIDALRLTQDMERLLDIAEKIDSEIEQARRGIADQDMKEAFLLLHKAKVAAMHNRQEYGYLTLNLEAVHAQFTDEALQALFSSSREACKAYISMLCLCFNPQGDDEYQLGSSYLQARLDEARKLNEEVLIAKHGYRKYTPKLSVYQLGIQDALTSKQFEGLSTALLEEFPSGKHALAVIDLKVRWALKMDLRKVPDLLQLQQNMIKDHVRPKQAGSSSEASPDTTPSTEQPTAPEKTPPSRAELALEMNKLEYSFWTQKIVDLVDQVQKFLDIGREASGIQDEDSSKSTWAVSRISSIRSIVSWPFVQRLLLKNARQAILNKIQKGPPCFFGFRVFLILESALLNLKKDSFGALESEDVQELRSVRESLRAYYYSAVEQLRLKHGASYKAYYSLYLDLGSLEAEADHESLNHLRLRKAKVEQLYTSLKTDIAAGSSTLSLTSGPVREVEKVLILILGSISEMSDEANSEITSIQLAYLTDFKNSQSLSLLHLQPVLTGEDKGDDESAKLLKMMEDMPVAELCEDAKSDLRILQDTLRIVDFKKKLIDYAVISKQCDASVPNSEEALRLKEQTIEVSKALEANAAKSEAVETATFEELVSIYGLGHFIPAYYFIFTSYMKMHREVVLYDEDARDKVNQLRSQSWHALENALRHDRVAMHSFMGMKANRKLYDFTVLSVLLPLMNTKVLKAIALQPEELSEEDEEVKKKILALAETTHTRLLQAQVDVKSLVQHLKQQVEKKDKEFSEEELTTKKFILLCVRLAEACSLYFTLDVANYAAATRIYDDVVAQIKASDVREVQEFEAETALIFTHIFEEVDAFKAYAEQEVRKKLGFFSAWCPSRRSILLGSALALGTLGVAWIRLRRQKNL